MHNNHCAYQVEEFLSAKGIYWECKYVKQWKDGQEEQVVTEN